MIVIWVCVGGAIFCLGLLLILAVIGSARLEAQTKPDATDQSRK
jgi:hypothetical protein